MPLFTVIALLQVVAANPPAPLVVMGPSGQVDWPSSYECKVITDTAQVIDFRLHISGLTVTLSKDLMGFEGNRPITMKNGLYGPKRGEDFFRWLTPENTSMRKLDIFQSGNPTNASTQVSFDSGRSDLHQAHRRPKASGFCIAGAD